MYSSPSIPFPSTSSGQATTGGEMDRNSKAQDMKQKSYIGVLLFLLATAAALPAHADWINLSGAMSAKSIAEFHVNDDHVKVVLEVYVHDLSAFMDLIPDRLLKPGTQRPSKPERMRNFSTGVLQIIAENKVKLPVQFQLIEPRKRIDRPNPYAGMINPITRQPVPGPPADKRVLYAELIYPFESGVRPNVLTFIPPLSKEGYPVSIGFIAYHKGVPIIDYAYLSEAAHLNLDWDDPWYSRFSARQYKRWQQSGLLTFLYMEPYEVRHETLVRLKDLAAWMDLGLRGDEFIELDEFLPLQERVGQFLLKKSRVEIDGRALKPILDRVSFIKRTMTRTYFLDQPERIPLNTAMIGAVVTYLTEGIPQKVTVNWDLFSDRIQKVPTVAEDPAGPFPSFVTPDDPVLVWQNFLKNYQPPTVAEIDVDRKISHMQLPAASIACMLLAMLSGFIVRSRKRQGQSVKLYVGFVAALVVGGALLYPFGRVAVGRPAMMAPSIEQEQAVTIVKNLLENVYRSFDFREESDIYDRLATSVSGNLLETIYLQNRKSLIIAQAGGARAKVKEVEMQEVTVQPGQDKPLQMAFHAKWTAMGTVGHWGHIHSRKNQYEANLSVEPIDGVWKITGLELLEEKRIDPYGQKNTQN